MISKNKNLIVPHGNLTIWRYMGLDKFLDLITTEQLFFTNAEKMTDKYEGVVPRKTLKSKRRRLEKLGKDDRAINESLSRYDYEFSSLRNLTLLNCWSINQYESYALWKIYLGGSKSGVAIKTNVSKLKKAIDNGNDPYHEEIFLGKVEYNDYIPDKELTRWNIVTTKNQFYAFENELRLFIFHYPLSEGGVKVPYDMSIGRRVRVDLDFLIEKIYLSPFAGTWFEKTFKDTVRKIRPNLVKRIIISEVQDE